MLNNFFGKKKSNDLSVNPIQARDKPNPSGPVKRVSRALKIIHAGGQAEYYYMAIPASAIIEKYPSFILARPEIFWRPWESIVRPEEILLPGQKYYVVPRQTVRKLGRRIRKTSQVMDPSVSFESKSLVDNARKDSHQPISGILVKPGPKVKARNQHVRFCGIETTDPEPGSGSEERIRARNENAWQPSLDAINEY